MMLQHVNELNFYNDKMCIKSRQSGGGIFGDYIWLLNEPLESSVTYNELCHNNLLKSPF